MLSCRQEGLEMKNLRVEGKNFIDPSGRSVYLKGINLSGSTKMPYSPYAASHVKDGFYDYKNVSFVGRPFPLEEADEHLSRLKSWGFNFLRLLITWEAIEHEGPGIYDQEYLSYLRKVVEKAAEYKINVLIDPHQDVWSRFTGGSGAPAWTLEKVGFDLTKLDPSGSAITHNNFGDPYPRMLWPSNYSKMATATMFTLFFGGNDFAPKTLIEGVPVQDYLQEHYFRAIQEVVKSLEGLPNVIGYETLNEPSEGWIGLDDLNRADYGIRKGPSPSAFQSMVLAYGRSQKVENWEYVLGQGYVQLDSITILNKQEVSAWRNSEEALWRNNGVWSLNEKGDPILNVLDYFKLDDKTFEEDYFKPFAIAFIEAIRQFDKEATVFIEPQLGKRPPNWSDDDPSNIVDASHWYDVQTLLLKTYNPDTTINFFTNEVIIGSSNVERSFADYLGQIQKRTWNTLGKVPTLIGEFGVPMDLDNGAAFQKGDFTAQIKALDAYYDGLEENLLHSTIWNYTPVNTNARGDQWNGEDLSIFSRDQQANPDDINSGGRALDAFVRPYAAFTGGELQQMSFDLETKMFRMTFAADSKIDAPTLIYVPNYHYPKEISVEVTNGRFEYDRVSQQLKYFPEGSDSEHTIIIKPKA